MRALALIAIVGSLSAQEPEIDLERERHAMRTGSDYALITLIAQHEDGTPVRGFIQCAGNWHKYQEGPQLYGEALPFATDARGAIVMNPHLSDEYIVCWSRDRCAYGRVVVCFDEAHPRAVHTIVLRRET